MHLQKKKIHMQSMRIHVVNAHIGFQTHWKRRGLFPKHIWFNHWLVLRVERNEMDSWSMKLVKVGPPQPPPCASEASPWRELRKESRSSVAMQTQLRAGRGPLSFLPTVSPLLPTVKHQKHTPLPRLYKVYIYIMLSLLFSYPWPQYSKKPYKYIYIKT